MKLDSHSAIPHRAFRQSLRSLLPWMHFAVGVQFIAPHRLLSVPQSISSRDAGGLAGRSNVSRPRQRVGVRKVPLLRPPAIYLRARCDDRWN